MSSTMRGSVPILDTLRDELTCCVCLDILNDPHVLPCLHKLCFTCANDIANSNQRQAFPCPTCRQQTRLDSLKKDFTTARIIEGYHRHLAARPSTPLALVPSSNLRRQVAQPRLAWCAECQLCDSNPTEFMCRTCNLQMCCTCKTAHMRSSAECRTATFERVGNEAMKTLVELRGLKAVLQDHLAAESDKASDDLAKIHEEKEAAIQLINIQQEQALAHYRQQRDKAEEIAMTSETRRIQQHSDVQQHLQTMIVTIGRMESELSGNRNVGQDIFIRLSTLKEEFESVLTTSFNLDQIEVKNRSFDKVNAIQVVSGDGRDHPQTSSACSLRSLKGKDMSLVKSYDLPTWIRKILFVNDTLWCLSTDCVRVYNPATGTCTNNLVEGLTGAQGMVRTTTEQIIVATWKSGMIHFNARAEKVNVISKQDQHDVTCDGDSVIGLSAVKNKLCIDTYDITLTHSSHVTTELKDDSSKITCAALTGFLFVCHESLHCIFKINKSSGLVLQTFGIHGSKEPGALERPVICAADDKMMLIGDWANHRLQILDCERQEWSVIHVSGPMYRPSAAAVSSSGQLLVCRGSMLGPFSLYVIQ